MGDTIFMKSFKQYIKKLSIKTTAITQFFSCHFISCSCYFLEQNKSFLQLSVVYSGECSSHIIISMNSGTNNV